ncbi:MAG: hypothetical protein JKY15_01925 [Deltaproteobacteria bacterium]|nr:hypothetical protein [Deltaproteobacteria bacterium]
MIWYILAELYQYDKKKIKQFLNDWDIELRPVSHTNLSFFKHTLSTSGGKLNAGIPSGHTGIRKIVLFLIDVNDWGTHHVNGDRVQHEICHARMLEELDFDTSSHLHVTAVHNETKRFFKQFNYWNWNWFKLRFRLSIIDIRVHLS